MNGPMMCGTAEVRPLFKIDETLRHELSRLEEQVEVLRQKLDPVLLPDVPNKESQLPTLESVGSQLQNLYRGHISKVEVIHATIADLLTRLDI